MNVELYTRDGGLVVRAQLPPFNTMPDVLFWGERIFRHEQDGRYKEAFAYAILPGQEEL